MSRDTEPAGYGQSKQLVRCAELEWLVERPATVRRASSVRPWRRVWNRCPLDGSGHGCPRRRPVLRSVPGSAAATAISRPSGDQAGGRFGRHGATSDGHRCGPVRWPVRVAVRRWRPPRSTVSRARTGRVRRNATRWPSGAHDTELVTSSMKSLGVPPRNGTRQRSANSGA